MCADARAGPASVNPQLAEQRCVHEEKSCGKPPVAFQVNFIFQSRHSLTVWVSVAPPFTSVWTLSCQSNCQDVLCFNNSSLGNTWQPQRIAAVQPTECFVAAATDESSLTYQTGMIAELNLNLEL